MRAKATGFAFIVVALLGLTVFVEYALLPIWHTLDIDAVGVIGSLLLGLFFWNGMYHGTKELRAFLIVVVILLTFLDLWALTRTFGKNTYPSEGELYTTLLLQHVFIVILLGSLIAFLTHMVFPKKKTTRN